LDYNGAILAAQPAEQMASLRAISGQDFGPRAANLVRPHPLCFRPLFSRINSWPQELGPKASPTNRSRASAGQRDPVPVAPRRGPLGDWRPRPARERAPGWAPAKTRSPLSAIIQSNSAAKSTFCINRCWIQCSVAAASGPGLKLQLAPGRSVLSGLARGENRMVFDGQICILLFSTRCELIQLDIRALSASEPQGQPERERLLVASPSKLPPTAKPCLGWRQAAAPTLGCQFAQPSIWARKLREVSIY